MKRIVLSCLTILFMVSFGFVAKAQIPSAPFVDPAAPVGATTRVGDAHIFICASQTRPVDLTYDVLKRHLEIDKGKWIATDNQLVLTGQYDGRNVFKVQGSSVGTYMFDFVSTSATAYCGVDENEYFRAYVHILPDFAGQGNNVARTACLGDNLATLFSNNPLDYIVNQAHYDYLKTLGGSITVAPATWTLATNATAPSYSYKAIATINPGTLIKDVNGTASVYPCSATTFEITLTISTDTLIVLPGKGYTLCYFDLLGTKYNNNAYIQLNRTNLIGRANVSVASVPLAGIIAPSTLDYAKMYADFATQKKYEIKFTYDDCKGVTQTVTDTIHLTNQAISYHQVTNEFCKTQFGYDTLNLTNLYNGGTPATTPNGYLPNQYVNWTYLGQNSTSGTFNVPNPYNDPLDLLIDKSKLLSATDYWFEFKMAAGSTSTCDENATAKLLVKAKDGGGAVDGRLQVCRGTVSTVKLNEIMGLAATTTWTAGHVGDPTLAAGVVSITANTARGQYVFNYSGTAGCGTKDGKYYISVTDKVIIPTNLEEKFCEKSLPSEVNLFNIIGTTNGTWATPAAPLSTYFDPITGKLDVAAMNNAPGGSLANNGKDYTFTFTGTGCLAGKTFTVKISFVALL